MIQKNEIKNHFKKSLIILILISFITVSCEQDFSSKNSTSDKEWHKLRMYADISRLRGIVYKYNGFEIYKQLTESIIPSIVQHIASSYKVKGGRQIKLSTTRCGPNVKKISDFYYQSKLISDFVMFFTFEDSNNGLLASASACDFDPVTGRPIAGDVLINIRNINDFSDSKTQSHFATLLHEINHALGFQSYFYSKYINPRTNELIPLNQVVFTDQSSKYTSMLGTPNLIKWSRSFYDCDFLQGVPLENSGGSLSQGSHWEKFIAAQDLMAPSDFHSPVISKLTLKLMEDTGWYKPNYDMAENYSFGKKGGCRFLAGDCNSHPQLCTSKQKQCSESFNGIGSCQTDSFLDGCPVFDYPPKNDCRKVRNNNPVVNQTFTLPSTAMTKDKKRIKVESVIEKYGLSSRCIEGGFSYYMDIESPDYSQGYYQSGQYLRTTVRQDNNELFCFEMNCSEDGERIRVNIEGEEHICERKGRLEIQSGEEGSSNQFIMCPNPRSFCRQELTRCPNDCSLRGRCLKNQTCWCLYGFAGKDCSKFLGISFEKFYTEENNGLINLEVERNQEAKENSNGDSSSRFRFFEMAILFFSIFYVNF